MVKQDAVAVLRVLLKAIDYKLVPLTITKEPAFCGYPEYTACGWSIVVFDDCGDWDYIQQATSPEGVVLEYEDLVSLENEDENYPVSSYSPKDLSVWGYGR